MLSCCKSADESWSWPCTRAGKVISGYCDLMLTNCKSCDERWACVRGHSRYSNQWSLWSDAAKALMIAGTGHAQKATAGMVTDEGCDLLFTSCKSFDEMLQLSMRGDISTVQRMGEIRKQCSLVAGALMTWCSRAHRHQYHSWNGCFYALLKRCKSFDWMLLLRTCGDNRKV